MAPRHEVKQLEEDEDEFTGELIHRNFLKIPTYTQGFVHIVSRIGYHRFLDHTASINGDLLPFTGRPIVEQAWFDLLNEKYDTWETVHSMKIKHMAMENGIAQIKAALYQAYCVPREKVAKPAPMEHIRTVARASMGFTPAEWMHATKPTTIEHPRDMYRLVKLPEVPVVSKKPPQKKHKRAQSPSDEDDFDFAGREDDDYQSSRVVKAQQKSKKMVPRKKKKVKMDSLDDYDIYD